MLTVPGTRALAVRAYERIAAALQGVQPMGEDDGAAATADGEGQSPARPVVRIVRACF